MLLKYSLINCYIVLSIYVCYYVSCHISICLSISADKLSTDKRKITFPGATVDSNGHFPCFRKFDEINHL